MEIFRFRPYNFTRPSQIVSLYMYDCMHYINRLDWTESQYLQKTIPLSWSTLRKLIFKTLYNWFLIFLLVCIIFPYTNFAHLEPFSRLFERTLHVAKIDLFLSSYLMTFAICEYTCVISAWMALTYNDTRWNVCYELKASVDRKLGEATKKKLLVYFKRNSTLAGIVNKVCGSIF